MTNPPPLKFPFYLRATIFLVGLFVFVSILHFGESIILPLIFATLFAVLISPAVDFLIRKKVNRAVAISIVLSLAVIVAAGIIVLVSMQASHVREAWPHLTHKFREMVDQTIIWISGRFNVDDSAIREWIDGRRAEMMSKGSSMIGATVSTVSSVMAVIVLIPVYIFMILYYEPHLLEFVHKMSGAKMDNQVSEVMTETKGIIKGYLVGLFVEFLIITVLNAIGLFAMGIEYALLLSILAAALNAIPYIGGIIGVLVFMIVALIAKSPIYVVYVVVLYSVIQFIDNHYIVPKVIGSKVKLNALICLIAVVIGGELWGVPGMFLSIPLTAIVKLVCDRVPSLRSWGFLLGDTTDDDDGIGIGGHIKRFIQKIFSRMGRNNGEMGDEVAGIK